MKKKVITMVGSGMMMGAGAMAVGAVGGPVGGVGNMAAMMPAVGSVMGAGMVLEASKEMTKGRHKGKGLKI